MKKEDLKSGMIVECRNGARRLVCNNSLIGIYKHGNLNEYDEDLNHTEDRNLDIVKIYNTPVNFTMNDLYEVESLRLLWQHPSTIITEKDICERFKVQSFRIPDIKPGMVVEYSDGEKLYVMASKEDSLYLANCNKWCDTFIFDSNSIYFDDIVKIYWPYNKGTLCDMIEDENLELVWRKITNEELNKAFGVNVTFTTE